MSHATVKWFQRKQFVGTDSSKHSIVISSQDEENGVGMRPSELLLIAMGSCTAIDIVNIMAKKRTPVSSLEIEVSGDPSPEPPGNFKKIHMRYIVCGEGITPDTLRQAIELSEEKYCMVAATVQRETEVTWDFQLLE